MYDNRRRAQNLKKCSNIAFGVFLLLLATGCHHSIRFEDIGYSLGQKEFDAGLVAVITPETVAQGRPITSIMTGAAHTWEAQPGEMLKQIAEVEFPQMVRYYRTASSYEEPKEGAKRLTVELSVPHYDFSEFHATVVVQAKAYGPGRTLIFDKSYRAEGDTQGAKRDIAEEILREEKRKAPSKIPYIISVVAKVSKFLFPKMFKLSTLSCFPGHAWKVHAFVPTATESSTRVRHRDARRVPLPEANVRDFERSHQVVQGAPQGSYSEHAWRAVCFKCC